MKDSGSEGSNSDNDEDDDNGTEFSIKAHDYYDYDVGEHTSNVASTPILVYEDGEEVGNDGVPLIHCNRNRGSIASTDVAVILYGGEGSSGG